MGVIVNTLPASVPKLALRGRAPDPPGQTLEDRDTRLGVRTPILLEGGGIHQTVARAPNTDGGDAASWRPLDPYARLTSGKQIPGTRYRLLSWIGEGGMGVVFEAIHVDIQRHVALKVVKHGSSLAQHDEFLAEAQAIARIESRFVVDVLDFGELPDGRPFYVMELLDSRDLFELIQAQGALPVERALPIMRQVCKALAAIHACGLAHRDIKPRNILLQTDAGRADMVRVVDFGISEGFADQAERIAGTLAYMAPEQLTGGAFDGRLDIYALGCVFHEMLSTKPVFSGHPIEVANQHLNATPDSLTGRRPQLPEQTDAFLARCLAKEPDDRFANVHEVEAALCELQIEAGFTTPWDDLPLPEVAHERQADLAARMPRPTRRASVLRYLGAGLGLAAALAIGAGFAWPDNDSDNLQAEMDQAWITVYANHARAAAARACWVYPPASHPDAETAWAWVQALEDRAGVLNGVAQYRAHQLRAEFAATLVRLGDRYWEEEHGRPFAVEYYAQALLFEPDNEHARSRVALTEAQIADVGARAARGEYSPAELETAEIIAALAKPDEVSRRARVVELVGKSAHTRRGLLARDPILDLVGASEVALAAAVPNAASVIEEIDLPPETAGPNPERAAALAEQGQKALAKGNRDKAERLFHKAIEADSRNPVAVEGLAQIYFDRGNYGKALGFAKKATQLQPRDAALRLLLGDVYLKVLRYSDARTQYQKSLDLGEAKAKKRLTHLDNLTG